MPLRQQEAVGGPNDVHTLLVDDRYLLVQIGPSNIPNGHKIIPAESYLVSPRGTRYTVEVEPHQFDIEQKFPYIRERVYRCDASGGRVHSWSNGVWRVHLAVDNAGIRSAIDQQIKFWTFFYNPLFHGPPN